MHGFPAQYPKGVEKLPSEHDMERDAVALYPPLQTGVHTDPEGVVAPQAENVSLRVSGSCAHGFGLHFPDCTHSALVLLLLQLAESDP